MRKYWAMLAVSGAVLCGRGTAATAADFPNPLPVENTMRVASLPKVYPSHWVFLDYLGAQSLIDSKVELIDISAKPPGNVRGQLGADQVANFLRSSARPEVYVAETFFARGTRGARTDVITIYDNDTLAPSGEIVLPGAKRGLFVIQPNSFQFADHEKLGLVFNFTPASSVTVVDLVGRKVLGETSIPGCALIYPTGPRGFSSLCANGAMLSVQLDAAGKVASQSETKPFNNLDDDPLFSVPAVIGPVSYFASFKGRVQPIDLDGAEPKLLTPWSLVSDAEAKANWRPSGWQLTAGGDGRLYVIMQPNGRDGSHKEGGDQVWVFDVTSHAKVATIRLKNPTQSIALSGGAHPMLLAASLASSLDVYDPASGALASSVPILSGGAPTIIHPVH